MQVLHIKIDIVQGEYPITTKILFQSFTTYCFFAVLLVAVITLTLSGVLIVVPLGKLVREEHFDPLRKRKKRK